MEQNSISVLIADDNKEFCNILNDYFIKPEGYKMLLQLQKMV